MKFSLPNVNANGIYNGSNQEDLKNEYYSAYKSLKKSAESFNSVHFHARDYDTEEFYVAREQRQQMQQKLAEVVNYLEQHVIELM